MQASVSTSTSTIAAGSYSVPLHQQLHFHEITECDFPMLAHYMELTDSRTCDYTLGGVVLWANHFGYRIAQANGTLFIQGGREDNPVVPAFSLPLGSGDMTEAINLLSSYCRHRGIALWLSAIPEDRLHLFATRAKTVVELGDEWSDYLYPIGQFVGLEGNIMKKKRNHVNRFTADHPDYQLLEMTESNARQCLRLLGTLGHDDTPTGRSEYMSVTRMLLRWSAYAPYFPGAILVADGEPVGFTAGEVKFDTLHVHVEKMNHEITGAGETLAHLFAAKMLELYPRLAWVNRQDDAGDPGLRAAKESWHPARLLPKFNVRI